MSKKINLPLASEGEETAKPRRRPSVEVARARLGGKPEGEGPSPAGLPAGQHVRFALASGRPKSGVIVYSCAAEVHVLLDSVRLRRFPPDEVEPEHGEPDGELAKIAADARVFAMLAESQPVRYATDAGQLFEGKLIEKCGYGALVLRDDGAIVAVGFRKLWPAKAQSAGEA